MKTNPSHMSINKIVKVAGATSLAYLVLYYALILFLNHEYKAIVSDVISPLGLFLSLIMMFYAIRLHDSKHTKRIWILFFLGTAAFLLGDINWAYNELIKGKSSFASMGDLFYAISAILTAIAFFQHIPQKSIYSALRSGFDVLIMMVVYLSLETKYVLLPVTNDRTLSALEKFSTLMYPIFDAGLFVVIILLYFNNANDKRHFKSKIMLLVVCLWLFADQTFIIMSLMGRYESGNWIDPLWPASFLGISIVALKSAQFYRGSLEYPKDKAPQNSQWDQITDERMSIHQPFHLALQTSKDGINNSRIILTYASMIIFMVIWCLNYIEKDPLSIGGIGIILLLIIRQYCSLLENQRLMKLVIQSNQELNETKSRIEYELRTDYLTRLFNRRYVDGAIAKLQQEAVVNRCPFSVLVLDIDYFKTINDRYGHDTGDQVLQQIAEVIKINIRTGDIAARWGGEEFIIILPDSRESLAYSIGERIRREIELNIFKAETLQEDIRLSVSIGISELDSSEQDFYKVILRADQGMYDAKYAGRNRTVIKRIS